jgi:catechol 2,3-dioxygenase-like lactoylglutathione lyase family enzyme
LHPLSFAAIGVQSLEASIRFYTDIIGFDIAARWSSTEAGAFGVGGDGEVTFVLLRASDCDIGRILLVASGANSRIREPGDRTTRGLWNINFYVDDIRRTARELRNLGFAPWTEPVEHTIGNDAGSAVEVLFDGPDGVAINLVQPLGDMTTFTGRTRAEADAFGKTARGFTPISTTSQCVFEMEPAKRFYQRLLGLETVMDARLGKQEVNYFHCRPHDAVSHTVFLGGGHFFGKISLNQPLNYAIPNRVERARPPVIGYFAQGFTIDSLDAAKDICAAEGSEAFGAETALDLGDAGPHRAQLFAVPGSGALVWLVEHAR